MELKEFAQHPSGPPSERASAPASRTSVPPSVATWVEHQSAWVRLKEKGSRVAISPALGAPKRTSNSVLPIMESMATGLNWPGKRIAFEAPPLAMLRVLTGIKEWSVLIW